MLVFINEDYTRPGDFAREVRRSGLRRRVYGGPLGPRWPTLRKLIRLRRQVVMLSQGDGGPFRWYRNGYQGLLQETPYNWATPNLLTDSTHWPASCQPNRGGTTGGLFLLNHWSPPVAPSPATSAVVNATATLVGRSNVCRFVRGRWPTLVAVDMFQSGGLFEAVRRLNAAAARCRRSAASRDRCHRDRQRHGCRGDPAGNDDEGGVLTREAGRAARVGQRHRRARSTRRRRFRPPQGQARRWRPVARTGDCGAGPALRGRGAASAS